MRVRAVAAPCCDAIGRRVSRGTVLSARLLPGVTGPDLTSMAVASDMRLVAVRAVLGVLLVAAVTWSISGYLFGISSTDVLTFLAIPLPSSGVALFAAWVPARRASRVDPVWALRAE